MIVGISEQGGNDVNTAGKRNIVRSNGCIYRFIPCKHKGSMRRVRSAKRFNSGGHTRSRLDAFLSHYPIQSHPFSPHRLKPAKQHRAPYQRAGEPGFQERNRGDVAGDNPLAAINRIAHQPLGEADDGEEHQRSGDAAAGDAQDADLFAQGEAEQHAGGDAAVDHRDQWMQADDQVGEEHGGQRHDERQAAIAEVGAAEQGDGFDRSEVVGKHTREIEDDQTHADRERDHGDQYAGARRQDIALWKMLHYKTPRNSMAVERGSGMPFAPRCRRANGPAISLFMVRYLTTNGSYRYSCSKRDALT